MAGRALWKGVVSFGMVTAPVKLYTAVREERISFNLLHADDQVRLAQEMVCPLHEKPVPREERVKGYELAENRYVVLSAEDLAALEPEGGRTIEITEFVPAAEIDARHFERLYYLGPDNDAPRFEVLRQALKKTGLAGVCRWTMRRRSYFGAVLLAGEALALASLRYGSEVVAVSELGLPEPKLDERELRTARYLIETMAADWNPGQYINEYQARLRELIEAKARGERIPARKVRRARATAENRLLKTLEASVEAAKKRKDEKKRAAG